MFGIHKNVWLILAIISAVRFVGYGLIAMALPAVVYSGWVGLVYVVPVMVFLWLYNRALTSQEKGE